MQIPWDNTVDDDKNSFTFDIIEENSTILKCKVNELVMDFF